ncbi:MAG: histidine kinase N-terminal 7TM domain-containing protein, partial [Candidatus Heimdallarchaeaceae archaeon]
MLILLLSVFALVTNFYMGIFVLYKNYKSELNRAFFLITLSIMIWSFGEFMMRIQTDPLIGTFWAKITWSGVVLIPATILNFSLILAKILEYIKIKYLKLPIFLPSILFVLIILGSNIFVSGVETRWWGFTAERVHSIVYYVYLVYHLLYISFALGVLYRTYSSEPKNSRIHSQIKYVFYGISIPFIIGTATQILLPVFNVDVFPIASVSTIILASLIGFSILKYGLMSITLPLAAKTILKTISDFLFVLDANSNIVMVNDAILNLGYRKAELIGKPSNKLIKLEPEKLKKLKRKENIKDLDAEIFSKNGKLIPVSLSCSSVRDRNGNLLGKVCIAKDMRKIKQRIKELKESKAATLNIMEDLEETHRELKKSHRRLKKSFKRLKELEEEKNKFIAIAAHELKTPLTTIHGFSQLLQDKKIANDTKKRDEYLKILEEETKRFAKLVTDMLDLSKLDI